MKKWLLVLAALTAAVPPLALSFPPAVAEAQRSCGAGYYRNARGNCIRRPVRSQLPPAGATAQCRDGTYSFSQSRRGTCSRHGGVARWL